MSNLKTSFGIKHEKVLDYCLETFATNTSKILIYKLFLNKMFEKAIFQIYITPRMGFNSLKFFIIQLKGWMTTMKTISRVVPAAKNHWSTPTNKPCFFIPL